MEDLCGECQEQAGTDSSDRVRQARLKPECADRYPTLPVRMWTDAESLAEIVAAWRRKGWFAGFWIDRPLHETDFEFRGGPGATEESLQAARRLL